MELQKRSLHMETPRLHASKQVVLEDNVIIPDTNKDADKLLLDRGKITIEEVSCKFRLIRPHIPLRTDQPFRM